MPVNVLCNYYTRRGGEICGDFLPNEQGSLALLALAQHYRG